MSFSDYVIYVDESGDPNLVNIDRNYPVFVLAFCIFHKRYYTDSVVTALEHFKFKHFGHDIVVLHDHEIRKEKGDFNIFRSKEQHQAFLEELGGLIETSRFVLISCVIDKNAFKERHSSRNENAYHHALRAGLDSLFNFLKEKNQHESTTHMIVECRGKKEDRDLELEFRRICDGSNAHGQELPFEIKFADKRVNSVGLQLSDLVARPIGVNTLRPEQHNRAFDVLRKKFFCRGGRRTAGEKYEGVGLIRLPEPAITETPPPKSEKPR